MVPGKSVILTIVDRFFKYAHFLPLGHPYMAITVVCIFFNTVVKLHGISSFILSNRDTTFTCHFWWELFKMAGIKLRFSSVFHPQLDG
jgi:hypothetical protein